MHIITPADTTMTITVSAVCPRCGTIGKSDKMSCCGRGGSWFKSCAGSDHTKLHHTWYEGIQACKARSKSKTVVGQQLNGAQQKDIDSSQGDFMTNYKSVIAASKTFALASAPILDTTPIDTSTYTPENVMITVLARTSMTNPSTNSIMTSSIHMSDSTSITTHLLKITVISIFCLSLKYVKN